MARGITKGGDLPAALDDILLNSTSFVSLLVLMTSFVCCLVNSLLSRSSEVGGERAESVIVLLSRACFSLCYSSNVFLKKFMWSCLLLKAVKV